jgi:hypothetical protein
MAISTRWYLPALAAGFFLSSQAAASAAHGCRQVSQASCAVAKVAAVPHPPAREARVI